VDPVEPVNPVDPAAYPTPTLALTAIAAKNADRDFSNDIS
jgi:hypothetical protein